ncbi:MAG: tricarballylate utilization 4Fe-4S protein TcuB [Rhodobacter sp.]|nr:tricarballylate utilization 4Fe-4S protein TcuB [Rhodobacter sp.]
MSLDQTPDLHGEARRQIEICNACRYCEGYCDVFPELHARRAWSDGDITHLANLCHNCRGCYYACQFTAPHEFDLNLPGILAEVRHDSWIAYAWPAGFARLFQRSGVAVAGLLLIACALLFWLASALRPDSGAGFYAIMSHGLMVALFAPAFLFPLASIAVSLRRYWRDTGGTLDLSATGAGLARAGSMRNLGGGHGDGCNFEDEDRYSSARRWAHQATMYGFLLCFAATVSGTVLHYAFGLPAPYGLISLPKLLGVPGGVLLCLGTFELARLKLKADRQLGAPDHWNGEMAFVLLLFTVGLSGLALYAATGTGLVAPLLALHLGAVLTFFLTMPYTKMVHGFYRLSALLACNRR